LLATALLAAPITLVPTGPASAQIGIGINITIAPPALPVYEPPPLPAAGYLWQPGYWDYGPDGYFWVPGTWVEPPQPGLLWTPGYWGFVNGAYAWNAGYWGAHVGFYGGVNYGFGYTGDGFFGGEWRGGAFFYNRAVINNFGNVHITNVYNRTVIVNRTTVNNVSFNGGPNGIQARPTAQQLAFAHEQHIAATQAQMAHVQEARQNRALLASANHGNPPIAATQRPGDFSGRGVVPARGAPMRPEEAARPALATRPGQFTRPTQPGRQEQPVRSGAATPRTGGTVNHPAYTRPVSEAVRRPTESPRLEGPRPVARPEAPRPEAPRLAPRPEAPRLAPRPEAPRLAPRPEAPHPAPRPAAPHPAAKEEKPR
jgi:hypothetical protein